MKNYFILFQFVSLFAFSQVQQVSSSEILLGLQKLNTVGSVLYIAAHPDDENTRLLSYLAKEKKVRTAYLSLTRGDGGQNLIGKEQGDALGLIRTHELLAARNTDGAEQYFTRANDFGYSKSPEETFTIWNKDSILADVVWAIRQFKPDVIIYRFPITGEGGHGHHTASGILAEEAFDAAADPKRFPHQLAYSDVWQAKRIFWNTFNFGGTNTTNENQLKLDVGLYNTLLGKSYGEIAAESRTNHKSQGFGSTRTRGSQIEYFKLVKSKDIINDVFQGIDFTWNRFPIVPKVKTELDLIIKQYSPLQPELSVKALVKLHGILQGTKSVDKNFLHYQQLKLKELEKLIIQSAGLWLEASANEYSVTPGSVVTISSTIVKRNNINVKLNGIQFIEAKDTLINLDLKQNDLLQFKHQQRIPNLSVISQPYWLAEKHGISMFTVRQQKQIGKPIGEDVLQYVFKLSIEGLNIDIPRPIVFKATDPVKGEVYRPFEVLPALTLSLSEPVLVFNEAKSKKIQVILKAHQNQLSGTLELQSPSGFQIDVKNKNFTLQKKGEEITIEATITPIGKPMNGNLLAQAVLNLDNEVTYSKSIRRIEYDHIPYQFILTDAEAKLIYIDLQKRGDEIAYIPGAGDDVANCLEQVGYNVTLLDDATLASADLSKYTAIITGVRAYNTNDNLQTYHPKLMAYIEQGGNLIVQYNTNSRVGPVSAKIGPYPFKISRNRITNEQAEVKILNPNHPVLFYPNAITNADFEGWVQERSIYHANELDSNYKTIFSMSDPGEKADDGSLIIAKYGKGNFVYTGLAFFRELPAGVPGAYRLFTNLLSLPVNNLPNTLPKPTDQLKTNTILKKIK